MFMESVCFVVCPRCYLKDLTRTERYRKIFLHNVILICNVIIVCDAVISLNIVLNIENNVL